VNTRSEDAARINRLAERKREDPNWEGWVTGNINAALKAVYADVLQGFRSYSEAEEYIEGLPPDNVIYTAMGDEITFSMIRVILDHIKQNKWYSPWEERAKKPPSKLDAKLSWTREDSVRRRKILEELGLQVEPYWAKPYAQLPVEYREKLAGYYHRRLAPMTGSNPELETVMMEAMRKSLPELRKQVSKVRYGKPGEILFEFQGRTYSAAEPRDVMPAQDAKGTDAEASRSWALQQVLDGKATPISPLKEPWQMTYRELIAATTQTAPPEQRNLIGEAVYRDLAEHGWTPRVGKWEEGAKIPHFRMSAMHKASIRQALAEGKPVPPEVLKDYPDLRQASMPGHAGRGARITEHQEKVVDGQLYLAWRCPHTLRTGRECGRLHWVAWDKEYDSPHDGESLYCSEHREKQD